MNPTTTLLNLFSNTTVNTFWKREKANFAFLLARLVHSSKLQNLRPSGESTSKARSNIPLTPRRLHHFTYHLHVASPWDFFTPFFSHPSGYFFQYPSSLDPRYLESMVIPMVDGHEVRWAQAAYRESPLTLRLTYENIRIKRLPFLFPLAIRLIEVLHLTLSTRLDNEPLPLPLSSLSAALSLWALVDGVA